MIKQNILSIAIILLSFNSLEAQVKYEREYRMSKEEVPQSALDFITVSGINSKVKWYKEEGPDGDSVEAKTKINSKTYSIDFDGGGIIEDIEIDIKVRKLDATLRENITTYLKSNYKKSKICKAQIQYVGSREDLIQVLRQPETKESLDITTRYELVVNVKEQRRYHKMEFLFDPNGSVVRKTSIIVKNTDNLEY